MPVGPKSADFLADCPMASLDPRNSDPVFGRNPQRNPTVAWKNAAPQSCRPPSYGISPGPRNPNSAGKRFAGRPQIGREASRLPPEPRPRPPRLGPVFGRNLLQNSRRRNRRMRRRKVVDPPPASCRRNPEIRIAGFPKFFGGVAKSPGDSRSDHPRNLSPGHPVNSDSVFGRMPLPKKADSGVEECSAAKLYTPTGSCRRIPDVRVSGFPKFCGEFRIRQSARNRPILEQVGRLTSLDPVISHPVFGRNPREEQPTATSEKPAPSSCRLPSCELSPKS